MMVGCGVGSDLLEALEVLHPRQSRLDPYSLHSPVAGSCSIRPPCLALASQNAMLLSERQEVGGMLAVAATLCRQSVSPATRNDVPQLALYTHTG